LDAQVNKQKLHWMIIVCLNPADLRRRENNYRWFLCLKEGRNCEFIIKIKRAVGQEQIGETFCLEPSNERAPYHSAAAGNEDFVRFLQLHCSL